MTQERISRTTARWFERVSRPRGQWLLRHRLSEIGFGLAVFTLALAALLAPPFTGLDTLPSAGVMTLSLGFLMWMRRLPQPGSWSEHSVSPPLSHSAASP